MQELVLKAFEAISAGADRIVLKNEAQKVSARRNKRSGKINITVERIEAQVQ